MLVDKLLGKDIRDLTLEISKVAAYCDRLRVVRALMNNLEEIEEKGKCSSISLEIESLITRMKGFLSSYQKEQVFYSEIRGVSQIINILEENKSSWKML